MRSSFRSLALFGLVALMGCGTSSVAPLPPCETDVCDLTGRVTWMNLEGGFFAIRGDDGVTYDTHNLPGAFREDGLRVEAHLHRRPELGCIHMAGVIADVINIRRL